MTQIDKDFEAKIKQSLDASVANIDADTQQRLDQIRRDALNQTKQRSWLDKLAQNWMPATGLAFCTVFALLVMVPSQQTETGNQTRAPQGQTAVLDLLENADDLEALTDPGFYLWVDETEQNHAV